MNAKILPLKGKYYETLLIVEHNGYNIHINLSGEGSGPSVREDWTEEELLESGENHYERQEVYEVATAITEALNKS